MYDKLLTDLNLKSINAFILSIGTLLFIHGIYYGYNSAIGDFQMPLGHDFYCFWSAGRLTLDGRILDIYDPALLLEFQQNYLGTTKSLSLPWFYPPLLLLYISCAFALLPYKIAYLVYAALSFVGYYCLARRFFPNVKPIFILGFPGFWFNLLSGQNGVLTAAILIGGLLLLGSSKTTSGIVFGLLSYKPQLCLALPIFLILEGQGKVIAAGIATLASLIIVSLLLFGAEVWTAFVAGLKEAENFNLLSGRISPEYLANLYGTLKAIGLSHRSAFFGNYLFAGLAACAAIRIWRLCPETQVKHAVVVLMTLLLPPHLLYYDFVVTGAVIVWLWPRHQLRPALMLLWIAPMVFLQLPSPGLPMLTIAAASLLYQLNRELSAASNLAVR